MKVVTRTVQFLSDSRDDEHLIEQTDLPEEEELADASEV
jgi:hypothetical protein